VGIRSQVQRLSRPHRGERRARRRRRGPRPALDGTTNGEALEGEDADLVGAIDGEADLALNGEEDATISTPAAEVDVASRVTAPLEPPTEIDTPL
jgi:hypothetical protein